MRQAKWRATTASDRDIEKRRGKKQNSKLILDQMSKSKFSIMHKKEMRDRRNGKRVAEERSF